MKRVVLDRDIFLKNVKFVEWHLPSKPPFKVIDEENGCAATGHEVISDGAPVMIKYNPGTAEFSVVTSGTLTIFDYATKERTEI